MSQQQASFRSGRARICDQHQRTYEGEVSLAGRIVSIVGHRVIVTYDDGAERVETVGQQIDRTYCGAHVDIDWLPESEAS